MKRAFVTSAALVAALASLAGTARAAQQPLSLFVLAGQSNMAGAIPFGAEVPTPNVYDVSLGAPKPAVDGLGDQLYAGPGIAIGAELHRLYPNLRIGLIQCAVGNTAMSRWAPGGDLYTTCLKRTLAARAYGVVRGVLFYQGEADAYNSTAAGWATRFAAMVGGFRQSLRQPGLMVVFAQLGRMPSDAALYPQWTAVQAEQASVKIAHVRMVSTSDIPSDVHYDAAGYATLGQRFASAWSASSRAGLLGPPDCAFAV